MSRILLISHIFPPAIDGGSRVIYKIGQYFQSQTNQILYLSSNCLSTDDFTAPPKTPYPKGSEGFRLPVYHHLRRPLKLVNLFLPQKSYLHQLFEVFQKGPIFRIFPFIKTTIQILKFKPDLIIAGPLPTTIILYANFFKKITQCQLLINASFHPTDPDFGRLPLIETIKSADYLWTLTQYETDYFIQNFKINPAKIILAGNGIDSDFLKNSPTKDSKNSLPFNLLFIGSLSAHKGLSTLLKSFSDISNYKPNISLTIAGQKTLYYPQLKQQISRLSKNTRSKIKFIFNFPQNQLTKIIDNCHVLVLPSREESFGLVAIEAWARKKPTIVSDIPSLSELTNRSHGGVTFKLDDLASLKASILQLINNPKLRHQLSQNGFNYVKNNYTWTIVGNTIKEKLTLF